MITLPLNYFCTRRLCKTGKSFLYIVHIHLMLTSKKVRQNTSYPSKFLKVPTCEWMVMLSSKCFFLITRQSNKIIICVEKIDMYLYLINLILSIIWRTVTCIILFVPFGRIMQYQCYLCQGNCVSAYILKLVVCIDKFQGSCFLLSHTTMSKSVYNVYIQDFHIIFKRMYVIMYGLQCITYFIYVHDVQTSS